MVVWNVAQGSVIGQCGSTGVINDVTLVKDMFATCGPSSIKLWKVEDDELLFYDVPLPDENLVLTAIDHTQVLSAPYNCDLLLVGTSKGDVLVVNSETFEFLHNVNVFETEIGFIKSTQFSILIGNESGDFVNSPVINEQNLF